MVQSKKLIAGLGVVAGLGVAMLPLGAFADDVRTGAQVVKAVVDPTLNLTVNNNYGDTTGGNDYVALTRGTANNTLIHTIRVQGNTYNDYKLTMNAKNAADVDLRLVKNSEATTAADRYDASNKIANTTTSTGVESLASGTWGYKYAHNTDYASGTATFSGNWLPIPTAGTAAATIDAAGNVRTASYDEYHYVNFGILAAENQVAGTYEATIEYNVTSADFN